MKLTIAETDIFSDLLFVLSTLLANIEALSKIGRSILKGCLTASITSQQKNLNPTIKACEGQR